MPRMVRLIIAAGLLVANPSAVPVAGARGFDPAGLDPATLRALAERGSVVVVDSDAKGKVSLVTAGIVVDAPPAQVHKLVSDFAGHKAFVPQVDEAKVIATEADHQDVEMTLKFKFSVITTSCRYTIRYKTGSADTIPFEIVDGDLKGGSGSYAFLPLEGGAKTLLFYSTIYDLRKMGFLTRKLLKDQPSMESAILASSATVVAAAVKKRAETPDDVAKP